MTNEAIRVWTPKVGGTGTKAVATASSTATTLGSPTPVKVWLKSTVKAHVIFGSSTVTAATTSHPYLTADVDYVFDVPADVTHFRVIRASTNGTLHYARVA